MTADGTGYPVVNFFVVLGQSVVCRQIFRENKKKLPTTNVCDFLGSRQVNF